MNALITAFEPFGGEAVNPSAMLLERLPGTVGRFSVRKLLRPVAYDPADRLLRSAFDPSLDLILCLGQAAGREGEGIGSTEQTGGKARLVGLCAELPELR